jgi:hypothetical protein
MLAYGEVDLCRFDGAALPNMHESGYGRHVADTLPFEV